MKELEKMAGKRMPYKEDDSYVANLIERCAENAVTNAKSRTERGGVSGLWVRACAVAAAVIVAVTVCMKLTEPTPFEMLQSSQPLADVLDAMSEDELMCVNYYVVEDIPEYEQ